jgi:tetratricopeptide (TPR) repeat protein
MADYYVRAPRGALEAARALALRALALEPGDPDAHLVLAEVHRAVDWDWARAEERYRLALSCNPSHEAGHRLYALFLAARGRRREAIEAARRACALDPLCLVVNTSDAWVRYLGGEFEAAVDQCLHTLDMDETFLPAHRLRAAALVQLNRSDEAIAILETLATAPRDALSVAWLAHALGDRGDRRRADTLLEDVGQAGVEGYVSSYHLAIGYTGAGRIDRAFECLESACDDRDPALMNVALEPRFAPLRSDARYRLLADRLS